MIKLEELEFDKLMDVNGGYVNFVGMVSAYQAVIEGINYAVETYIIT